MRHLMMFTLIALFLILNQIAQAQTGCIFNGVRYPVGAEITVGGQRLRCTPSGWQEI